MDAKLTGQKIAQLRKEKGKTQGDLAEALHISIAAVSKWERGLNFPDLTLLEPLAETLDTTAAELLGLENAPADEVIRDMAELSEQTQGKKSYRLLFRVFLALVLVASIIPLGQLILNALNNTELQKAAGNLLWPLCLGVISWTFGAASLISGKCWRGLSCLSWVFCAWAMYFPVTVMDWQVKLADLSAIEDTAWGWHWGTVILLTGTALLSVATWLIHILMKRKQDCAAG